MFKVWGPPIFTGFSPGGTWPLWKTLQSRGRAVPQLMGLSFAWYGRSAVAFLDRSICSSSLGAGRAREAHTIPLLWNTEIISSNWRTLNIWKSVSIIILETSYGNKRWVDSGKISSKQENIIRAQRHFPVFQRNNTNRYITAGFLQPGRQLS